MPRSGQPLSAAKAAELLNKSSSIVGQSSSFTPSLFAAAPLHLDPQCQTFLKQLTKKDALTRQKALQALNQRVTQLDEDALQLLLPQWLLHYPRLVLDTSRCVVIWYWIHTGRTIRSIQVAPSHGSSIQSHPGMCALRQRSAYNTLPPACTSPSHPTYVPFSPTGSSHATTPIAPVQLQHRWHGRHCYHVQKSKQLLL